MKISKIEEDNKNEIYKSKKEKNRLTKTDRIQIVKTSIMNWFGLALVITNLGLR